MYIVFEGEMWKIEVWESLPYIINNQNINYDINILLCILEHHNNDY